MLFKIDYHVLIDYLRMIPNREKRMYKYKRNCQKGFFMYLQIALPNPFVVQTAPGPQGLGLQGSGFSIHLWFSQT